MSKVRNQLAPRGWAMLFAVSIVKPAMLAATAREWIDGEKIPARGGCVVVTNHLSMVDPFATAHLIYDHGRLPRYLGKEAVFEIPVIGRILRSAGQIPVRRMSAEASGAFTAAVAAVNAGELVAVYPEGTLTKDPDLWPMRGKSGAARIALATGCPVIPIGHWGAEQVLAPYSRRLRLFPRRTIRSKVGDPVDLSGLGPDPAGVAEATDRIMAAITALVAELRGEIAPVERFDPRAAGVAEIGDPRKGQAPESSNNPQEDS